ncbi:sulfate reduction electron transfer complex DsrMKJOP subunit DsrJ [Planctomycetota bacterium]
MYDKNKVVGGIVIFAILVTSPLWYNVISASPSTIPDLEKPPNGAKTCVETKEFMRPLHMDLLNDWREEVVRNGKRYYHGKAAWNKEPFEMSLTRTCLGCHSNKEQFCDACHNYLAVDPYCWDCHVVPKEGK